MLRGHNANPWDLGPWELLRDRYDVRVLVTRRNGFDTAGLELPRVPVRALRDVLPAGRAGALATLALGDRYLGLARHLAGADVVHAAEIDTWFSAGAARLRRRLGFRLALTVWETIPFLGAYRTGRGRRLRARTLAAADLLLPTTERARAALVLEGVRPERIRVHPPGIDRERFAGARASPPAAHLVLSPGRLVWEKGHQDVLRAVAALDRGLVAGPRGVRVLVVGAGPDEGRLRRHAAELGLAGRVEFRPSVPYDEMPAVHAGASCMVLASLPTPAWEEQFGMVLAEAMAAGTPVIAAASGAIPEVVGPGVPLVRPGDWMGIARALAAGPLAGPPGARAAHDPERLRRHSTVAAAERLAAAYAALT